MRLSPKLQKLFDTTSVPESTKAELEALPDDKMKELLEAVQALLEKGDVPREALPYIVAVIKEYKRRSELLDQKIVELQQETANKKREHLNLKHETNRLRQIMTLREQQAAKVETTGSFTPRRNDPCPCGSGKKYKHCCGK